MSQQQPTPTLQPGIEEKGRNELVKFLTSATAPSTPIQAWLLYWRTQYDRQGLDRAASVTAVIEHLVENVGRNLVHTVPPTLGPNQQAQQAASFIHIPGKQPGAKPSHTGIVSVPRKQ